MLLLSPGLQTLCAMVTKYRLQNEEVHLDPSTGSYNPKIIEPERMSIRNSFFSPRQSPLKKKKESPVSPSPEYI